MVRYVLNNGGEVITGEHPELGGEWVLVVNGKTPYTPHL